MGSVADQNTEIQEADDLYERFAKPLEREHLGEYVVVSRDGRIMLGEDINDLARKALKSMGRGNFIFKIGERAVGKWR
jgi:hypothetical protein